MGQDGKPLTAVDECPVGAAMGQQWPHKQWSTEHQKERHGLLVITTEHRAGQVARQASEKRQRPKFVLVAKK